MMRTYGITPCLWGCLVFALLTFPAQADLIRNTQVKQVEVTAQGILVQITNASPNTDSCTHAGSPKGLAIFYEDTEGYSTYLYSQALSALMGEKKVHITTEGCNQLTGETATRPSIRSIRVIQ